MISSAAAPYFLAELPNLSENEKLALWQVLSEKSAAIVSSCTGLAEESRVAFSSRPHVLDEDMVLAVLSGKGVRAVVKLFYSGADWNVFLSSRRKVAKPELALKLDSSLKLTKDFIMELCNQVSGALKLSFSSVVEVNLSLPMAHRSADELFFAETPCKDPYIYWGQKFCFSSAEITLVYKIEFIKFPNEALLSLAYPSEEGTNAALDFL